MSTSGTNDVLRFVEPKDILADAPALTDEERAGLDRVNHKVAAGESLSDIMDFLFDGTRDLFPCDRIGLAFIDDTGARVTAYWSRALYEPLLLGTGYAEDLAGSSLETVVRSDKVRIINDLEAYLEMKPMSASTKLLVDEGVRSSMTCPLWVDGRMAGLLFRSSRDRHAYDDRQIRLHLEVAERLSQAVEKAYRIEQLEAANRAYTEMLAFVSHELKHPIASIMMDTEVLEGGYLGDLTDKQREKIAGMARKAEHVLSLARDYLDLAKLERDDLEAHFEPVEDIVDRIVRLAVEMAEPGAAEKDMVIEPPVEPVSGTVDPDLMQVALINLVGNAVKYGCEGGRVRVSASRDEGSLRISVWNEGPGFTPVEKGKLFKKFSRLNNPELRRKPGTGVGLYTTWRIAQVHGGRVIAESEPGVWARFTLVIPQPPNGG